MKDKGNWDYDHREEFRTKGHVPYSMLDRSHTSSSKWAQDRRQHSSSEARRRYKSSANKHTRQYLNKRMEEAIQDDN